jgi:aldose 1-epimerase
MEVGITNYGGIVTSMSVTDRRGCFEDVVLGFDDLNGYLQHPQTYFGAILGRYANRVGGAAFDLGDRTYHLSPNSGKNSLHGGKLGFDKRTWSVDGCASGGESLRLTYVSPDGEEGYPGELTVCATYTLSEDNELRLDIEAETTAETVVNLTDHSDFNLAGNGSGDVVAHRLTILADRFLPVADGLIPTGELRPVEATPFDFRQSRQIGQSINEDAEQLRLAGGYDHTFVLNSWDGSFRLAAHVHEPSSGRVLDLYTTQPGVHFYSGNFLDGSIVGKAGRRYLHRGTFYLGSQHFPDSPNQPSFPSSVLRPGEIFRSTNMYRFSIDPISAAP